MLLNIPPTVSSKAMARALGSIGLAIDGLRNPDGSHRVVEIPRHVAQVRALHPEPPPCVVCGEPASLARGPETYCTAHYQIPGFSQAGQEPA